MTYKVEILPETRWPELAEIISREFDGACLPASGKAKILVRMDGDKIIGFMIIEFLARIGQIWNTGAETKGMFDWVDAEIPKGQSVIAIASSPRFHSLCEKYGMREVEGTVFRKDY